MSSRPSSPAAGPLSIVIEWENAGRIGIARARRMLAALNRQLGEVAGRLEGRPDILILFNPALTTEAEVRGLVDAAGAPWPADVRLLPATSGEYYAQKNHGASLTSGAVLIFLDSDVVPEPGWLAGLLDGIGRPGVDVVCGTTSIEPGGFYASAMALVWFFPLRSEAVGLVPTRHFFANNVAFRRAVFDRHGFPDSRQYRGQCQLLADRLTAEGRGLWIDGAVRVLHPPPEDARHFVLRALWQGHDDVVHRRIEGRATLRAAIGQFRRDARWVAGRVRRHRREVGLGRVAGLAAIGLSYFFLKLVGSVATLVAPSRANRLLLAAGL